MAVVKYLAALACLAISVSGFAYKTDSLNSLDCDFTGIDMDAAISRMTARLPQYEFKGNKPYRSEFAGIKFLGVNVTGVDRLRRYGPIIPYCINGTRMVQVDLVNDADVMFTVPWEFCDGTKGTINLMADFSRFTTQLRIRGNGPDEVSLSHEGPMYPVTTEAIKVRVTGAGQFAMMASNTLSMLFPAMLRELWNEQFFYYVNVEIDRAAA
ncbi:hypothetical protein HPB50_027087 [Hyalomma asiaticum]|uniref:Uncharacterized protein n=1 Tax=Hyalomma asiaticum TaxID=266040 RepID=A0ACB7RXC9_HYAAI|nr:hypothetical protein HPB50_027087 [Hyalomma asiaticum]